VTSPVPRLAGLDQAAIVRAMQDFRSGQRAATVMDRIAKASPTRRSRRSPPGTPRSSEGQPPRVPQARRRRLERAPPRSPLVRKAPPHAWWWSAEARRRELRPRSPPGDGRIAVTLVEANATFTACPFSNAVIRRACAS